MEVKKIYAIIDFSKYTKEDVIKDIKEEGYKHDFFFGSSDLKTSIEYMRLSDEVWLFGNCEEIFDYKIAMEMGKDIWKML